MATAATQAQAALGGAGNLDRVGCAEVIDLGDRRRLALERDDSNPELWLDDGVIARAQEVSRWPARR
jgi:hypothetical protein